jgi:hypothetical protein
MESGTAPCILYTLNCLFYINSPDEKSNVPETITIGVNNGNQTLRRVAAKFGIDLILDLPFDIKKFSAVLIERLNE